MNDDELTAFMVDNNDAVVELQYTIREIVSLEGQIEELRDKRKRIANLLYRAPECTAYYALVDLYKSFTEDIDERVKHLEKLKALLW